MNSLIQKYRTAFSAAKDRTDAELLRMLGEEAEANGVLEQQPDDFKRDWAAYKDAIAPTAGEAFKTGVARGVRGLGSTALGFGALVADWIPGTATDKYIRDPLLRETAELEAPREGEAKQLTWDDVTSAKTLASYLAQHTGNALPSVAESILVSVGAGLATGGPGAVAGIAGKEAMKALAKSKLRNIMLAQGVNSLALSSGEIYADLAKDKDVGEDDARFLATGLGVVAAIPDTILPSYIAAKFVKPAVDEAERGIQKSILKELGKEAFKTIPAEATTEAFQEYVNIAAGKLAKGEGLGLSESDWKRMREAAVGGAAGGAISAPLAAYGEVRQGDAPPAQEQPAATPAKPRVTAPSFIEEEPAVETNADVYRRVVEMTDEEAKLRFAALNKLTELTPLEQRELDLITGLNATKWKQATPPPPAAAPVTPAPAAPAPVAETPAPAAPAVKPEEATPATPVAAVKAPEPMTATQIMQRTERISDRIFKLVERGADVREAKRLQGEMIESGLFTREGFTALEEAVTKAEMADVALRAKVKAGDAKLLSDREREIEKNKTALAKQKKDAAAAIRKEVEQKRQDKSMARLTEQLKKLYPTTETTPQGPTSGAGSAPNTGSGVETAPAPVVPFSFGRLVEHKDFGLLSLKQAKETNWVEQFEKLFLSKTGEGKVDKGSGIRQTGANASQTTIGVAFLDPKTGKVYQRGLMKNMAVQDMARYEGDSRAGERVKVPSAEGKNPLPLAEVTQAGFIPLGFARFESAGRINQDFADRDAYMTAAESTPLAAVQAESADKKALAAAAKDAERAKTAAGAQAVVREQKKAAKDAKPQVFSAVKATDSEADADVVPIKAPKKESAYGSGPWEIQHNGKVVREIALKEKGTDGKLRKVGDKFISDAFAEAIRDKAGKFTLIDGDGNTVASVEQKRATKRKQVKAKATSKADMRRVFALLSEQAESESGAKSVNWIEALRGKPDDVLRDFLLGQGDFGVDGKNFSEMMGGYNTALQALHDTLKNYDKLADSREGSVPAKDNRGAGADGGSVVPAKRGGKSGGRKAKSSAGEAGARAGNQERRAGDGGEGRVAVGRDESDLDGRVLTEGELKDAAIKGIYKATSLLGKGQFDELLLRRFPANVREAVTDLLSERGMEWDDFASYIQSAFDASNTAEDFLAIMRGETKASVESYVRDTQTGMIYIDGQQPDGASVSVVGERVEALGDLLVTEKDASRVAKVGERFGLLTGKTRQMGPVTASQVIFPDGQVTFIADRSIERVQASVESDQAEYDAVQAEMQKLGHDKAGTPEYNQLWQKSEDIKNRYQGDMPKYGQAAPAFTPVDGYGLMNVVNPLTGRLESPFAAPDTVKAIEHNAAEAERRAKQSRVDESSPASIEWTDAPPPDQTIQRRLNEFAADLNREVLEADRKASRPRSPAIRFIVKQPGAALSGAAGRGVSQFTQAVELIGKAFKKRIVFVEIQGGAPGMVYRGLTSRQSDIIAINVISGVSVVKILGHELTHNLKAQKPELYKILSDFIALQYPPTAGYVAGIKNAGDGNGAYDESDVSEEWVADIVGENFADPEFWKNFKGRAKTEEQNIQLRNLATYIGGWVSRIFQSFKRVLNRHSAEVAQAAKLQKLIAEVMSQYAGTEQFTAPMLEESGDILKSVAFIGDDNTAARMRIDAAAINEVLPVYEAAHRALAPNAPFDQFMQSVLWKGDLPEAKLTRIEKIARGTRQTALTDLDARSRAQAVAAAYTLVRKNETEARDAAAAMATKIAERSDEVIKLSKKVLKVERGYQDASLMNAHFHEQLKEIITGVAKDEGRKAGAAFRLGELTQAVRMLESMEDGAPLPVEYQRVFERVATSDTASLFDHMQALAKLNLPLADMSVKAIFDAMGSSGVTTLTNLTATNKPLAVALAALARNNQKEMDLLQVRVMASTKEKVEAKRILDEITTASDDRLESLWGAYEQMLKSNDAFSRLAARYIRDRRTLRTKQTELRKLAQQESLLNDFARRLEEKRLDLGKEAGDFANWHAMDRGTYSAMRQNKEGKWVETKRTLHLSGADAETNGEQLHKDVAANRAWLEMHPHLKGTPLYNSIEVQWQQLSKIDFLRISKPANRFFADKFLASMSEKFRMMGGVAPVAVAQMLQRYQFITRQGGDGGRTWHDSIVAMAKRYEVALKGVTKAAGYKAPQLFSDDVRDHVIAYLESQDGKDIESSIRGASRVARRYIPQSNVVAEDFAEKLREYITRLHEISSFMPKVAEKNGTYIEDAHIDGWLRKILPRGAITVSRKIRTERLLDAIEAMDAAKWEGNPFAVKDDEGNETGAINMDAMSVFTPDVMRLAVIPFIMKPGEPAFFGADKTDGNWSYLSQTDAQRAWEASDKTVVGWIEQLFDATYMPGQAADPAADRAAYTLAMLGKLSANANLLRNTHKKVTEKNPHSTDTNTPLPHRLQDGRKHDNMPPDFLKYDSYDVVNAEIMLNEIAYHAAFGRDGERVDALLRDGGAIENEINGRVRDYLRLRGVTEKDKERDAIARGWDWKALRTAASDQANFRSLRAGFYNRFGLSVGMEQGPERAWWESLKTIAALVLNQPTSGLWNIPTILDFPLVVGGKSGYRASARALKDVVKGLVGSPLSALGVNLFRMSDYWTLITEARHGAESELTLKEHMTAIGKDGSYYEGGIANRATQASRFVQNVMKRGIKTKGGHLPFNGLWAPFNFIGETVTTAVAVGNVENVEMMVKRAVEFFRHNADAFNDPTYKLTAKDLKMNGPAYFNDERAFDYYRTKLTEFHLGTLEDMARGAMGRPRVLTDEQVMMVAQMSFNEISLESSINSRPMGWVENPVLRYGGLLMGWPLMQMDKTHRAMKGVDGKKDWASVGRGLGVLALWTLPMGLAFSFLMDEWDEEVVGKRSNRREVDLTAAIPGIGPLMALATSDRGAGNTFFGMLERAAKSGVYGLGLDAVNGMTNIVDSKSGQREFSLDARVLAFSQFVTLSNVARNLIHQDGTYTYESVGRPLFMALGGNGLIQGMQIVSNLADLDTEERLIANRISVGNYLRAAGRDAEVELKAGAGRSSPTPVTVWQREMYLAAIGNDRARFLEAYRAAVAAARAQGDDDPEGTVLAGWKRRSPLESVFSHKPTDAEMGRIMRAMNDDGRRAVQDVVRLYDDFTYLIEPTPAERAMKSAMRAATRLPRPPALMY